MGKDMTKPGRPSSAHDDAAERFAEVEAIADGEISWTFAEFRTEIHRAAAARWRRASRPATGSHCGRRTVGRATAALGVHVAGGIVVPINTCFKGREAAYVMEASQVRVLFTVTDFLNTDYVSLLTEAGLPAKLEEVIVLRGSVPETATDFAPFMDRAGEVDAAAVVAAETSGATTSATSCSPRAPRGRQRGPCSPIRPPAGVQVVERRHRSRP